MNDYRFDMSNFTIADMQEIEQAVKSHDVSAFIRVANRFIPIDLFALPFTETPIIVNCFREALQSPTLGTSRDTADDRIDQLIRKALEDV